MERKKIEWREGHARIFSEVVEKFNDDDLKYFILRNYEGLPDHNPSKDIDFIIEPGKYKAAAKIISEVYTKYEISYRVVKYERVRCWYGFNLKKEFSIHLDLIVGYLNKGFEIFRFEDLYNNTILYKNFRVLETTYDAAILLYYKLIMAKKLSERYRVYIENSFENHQEKMSEIILKTVDKKLADKIIAALSRKDFVTLEKLAGTISLSTKKRVFKNAPIRTTSRLLQFLSEKFVTIGICPRKKRNLISVHGADGTGKTTFIEGIENEINFYFNSDGGRVKVYHFRPTILPNLGAVGEKAGVMKEDKNFTDPHRRKPAGGLSSFFRLIYYWIDYLIGMPVIVRKGAQFDLFTIFDRYVYDFLIDPHRSRINLPFKIRSLFSKLVIQPRISFVLIADSQIIYKRKQELTVEEIERQLKVLKKLADNNKRFILIDANKTPDEMVSQAMEVILKEFSVK